MENKPKKIYLVCPNCGGSRWITENGKIDENFQCSTCGKFWYADEMDAEIKGMGKQRGKVVMTEELAIDAFSVKDDIEGMSSGGIDPPSHIVSTAIPEPGTVAVFWKSGTIGGLTDRIYRNPDPSVHAEIYRIRSNKLERNGSADNVFGEYDEDYAHLVDEFYGRWPLDR